MSVSVQLFNFYFFISSYNHICAAGRDDLTFFNFLLCCFRGGSSAAGAGAFQVAQCHRTQRAQGEAEEEEEGRDDCVLWYFLPALVF